MLDSLLRTAGPRTCISVAAPCILQHNPAPEITRWISCRLSHEPYLWRLLHLIWRLMWLCLGGSLIVWRWCRRGGIWRVRRYQRILRMVSRYSLGGVDWEYLIPEVWRWPILSWILSQRSRRRLPPPGEPLPLRSQPVLWSEKNCYQDWHEVSLTCATHDRNDRCG